MQGVVMGLMDSLALLACSTTPIAHDRRRTWWLQPIHNVPPAITPRTGLVMFETVTPMVGATVRKMIANTPTPITLGTSWAKSSFGEKSLPGNADDGRIASVTHEMQHQARGNPPKPKSRGFPGRDTKSTRYSAVVLTLGGSACPTDAQICPKTVLRRLLGTPATTSLSD